MYVLKKFKSYFDIANIERLGLSGETFRLEDGGLGIRILDGHAILIAHFFVR